MSCMFGATRSQIWEVVNLELRQMKEINLPPLQTAATLLYAILNAAPSSIIIATLTKPAFHSSSSSAVGTDSASSEKGREIARASEKRGVEREAKEGGKEGPSSFFILLTSSRSDGRRMRERAVPPNHDCEWNARRIFCRATRKGNEEHPRPKLRARLNHEHRKTPIVGSVSEPSGKIAVQPLRQLFRRQNRTAEVRG